MYLKRSMSEKQDINLENNQASKKLPEEIKVSSAKTKTRLNKINELFL